MTDLLPVPQVDPLAELPEVTPYGRNWVDSTVQASAPAPVITAAETYRAGWCWWPSPVLTLEKRAKLAGYETRIAFARGYKPGRRKNTWELWDTIGVWLDRSDRPRVVFTWERSPDQGNTWERSPDQGNTWKALSASFRGRNGVVMVGHTVGKGML